MLRALCLYLYLAASLVVSPAFAQEKPPATDAAALDHVIGLLSNDTSRQQMLKDLQTLKSSLDGSMQRSPTEETETAAPKAAGPAAATADPAKEAIISDTGLMGAVAGWITDIARRLPNAALGAPIDLRLTQAQGQLAGRLTQHDVLVRLGDYLATAAPAWAIAIVLFWLVRRIVRSRLPDEDLVELTGTRLAASFFVRLVAGLIPLILAIVSLFTFVSIAGLDAIPAQLAVLPVIPFLIASTIQREFCLLLMLVGRSRGWRLVVYARRRLAPWIGAILCVSSFAGVASTPAARVAIGWATADIASLILDLTAAVISIVTVSRHRRTVRSLIVKRGTRRDLSKGSALRRAITSIGNRWHLLAYTFLALNIGARLLGTGRGSFLVQAITSILIVVAAAVLVSVIDRWFDAYSRRLRTRWNAGARDAILVRLARVAGSVAQAVIFLFAVTACLGLWGFDLWQWARSQEGQAILRPIFAIASALVVAWVMWISLDAWIETALTSTDRNGHPRPRSARIKTLLPLLRNFAFVVLTVMTVIAVLANLGVNVAPLLAGAGVVGLAVGFGSQQLVQDVITGLFMLLEDTLAIGDVVDTGDRSGTVEALTIRTVKIRDGDGGLHTIPFSSIKALKNSSRGFGVYTVTLNLDPSADVDKAVEVMREVGKEVASDQRFASNIILPLDVWGVDQVGPDFVVIKGAIRTRPLQQWGVGREINRRLSLRLNELGIPLANRSLMKMATPLDRHPVADGVGSGEAAL